MAKKKSSGGGHFLLGAFFGAIAGAAAGILTAPKSGKETQADLAREGKKIAKKAEKEINKISGKKPVKKKSPAKKSTAKKPATKKK